MRRTNHRPRRAPGLLLAVMPLLITPTLATGATFVVTTTATSGAGSLDWAITQAESNAGPDTIAFNIPGAGPHTIAPLVAFPTITQPVVIDGYTQPGASPATGTTAAVLKIELNGQSAYEANGFTITGSGCAIRGLAINRFAYLPTTARGILLWGGGDNVIEGNYIGTSVAGSADLGNAAYGIEILDSPNNTIGGSTPAARNVISGNNSQGIYIHGSASTGNAIKGNYIGLNAAGTANLGNSSYGVRFEGAANNTIGGTTAGERNIISGNNMGVYFAGSGTNNNVIQGNYIGTDVTGSVARPNTYEGIYLDNAPQNTIGGAIPGAGNLVSGNYRRGILVYQSGSTGNVIQGNLVGTNAAGTADLGNYSDGIKIDGANNNTIGGTTAAARNVVSGNGYQAGIYLNNTSGNIVQGNYAGTDITGSFAIHNDYDGIIVHNSSNNTIGGTEPGAGNVFSGNGDEGIDVYQSGSHGNIIQGNYVGLNAAGTGALGNTGDGVYFDNSNNNTVGGITAAAQNRIAYNSCRGIKTKGSGNAFLGNSVFSNAQLGIDLYPDGVTANDLGDGDTGANNLQNYPVLLSANSDAAQTLVHGTLNSTATTAFRLEFFSSPTADGSGYGEGQVFLGYTMVTTDASGNVAFTATLPTPVQNGHCVAATATNPANSTSEFSQVVYVVSLALAAELTGGQVVLTWNPVGPAQEYWVYGASNDPVFAPQFTSPYAYRQDVVPAGTTTWSSANGVGDITNDWTYLVVAVGAGESIMATSNRVGEETYEGDIP